MDRQRLVTLLEIAVMAAIGGIFSYFVALPLWPQGGSVSLAMVPIVVLAFRRGWVAGMVCGLLVGLINLMFNPFIVHPVQLILDYPLAYALLGLAGAFRPAGGGLGFNLARVSLGVAVAGLARLAAHFVSGVVWFGSYAPEGTPVALYSFLYNASYIVPDILVSIAVMALLLGKAPHLVTRRT